MIKPLAPCKGCERRYPGCHSACEKYKTFRADLNEYNAEIRIEREQQQMIDGYEHNKGIRLRRKR